MNERIKIINCTDKEFEWYIPFIGMILNTKGKNANGYWIVMIDGVEKHVLPKDAYALK